MIAKECDPQSPIWTSNEAPLAGPAKDRLPGRITIGGRPVHYMNNALPCNADGSLIAPLDTCICPQCGHGYAELMRRAAQEPHAAPVACEECRIDQFELSDARKLWRDANAHHKDGYELLEESMRRRQVTGHVRADGTGLVARISE